MGAAAGARILPVVLAAGLLLAGCASGPDLSNNHHHRFRPGQPNYTVAPYQVNGVWYYPKVDYGYDETGTASWYGPGFDGHATSDGEIYDMNGLSAAHKTLPLPSVVQVTNLKNGRSVRLRVNDRGPFVDGRIIDLSRHAAQLLGVEPVGTAPVRVTVLREESIQVAAAAMHGQVGEVLVAQTPAVAHAVASAPRAAPRPATRLAAAGPPSLRAAEVVGNPPPATAASPSEPAPSSQPAVAAASRRYWPSLIAAAQAETLRPSTTLAAAKGPSRIFIQAGTFAIPENAQRVRARIAALGSAEIVPMSRTGGALYRVRLGPVANEAAAARLLRRVVDSGYPGARLVGE